MTEQAKPVSRYFFLILLLAAGPLAAEPPAQQPPSVGVTPAQLVRLAPTITLPGSVVSLYDSQLASEVEGRVAWVANVGTVLAPNGIVARIDQTVIGTQLDSDRANVARISAQLHYDRAQSDRMESLFQQGAVARATRDQAASTRDVDVGALAQARAVLRKSQYQYAHSVVRAPFAGRVVQRLINPGEYATTGKPLVRLVDIDSLEVSAQMPIDSVHGLHEGQSITVQIEGRTIEAALRAIVPVGDLVSRSIELRIALPAHAAFVGEAAKVMVPAAVPRSVVAVPRDAIVLREDNTYVFTLDRKNIARRVAVETGSEDGALVEIRGAVTPGQRVIVRGAERLEAGQKVRAVGAS